MRSRDSLPLRTAARTTEIRCSESGCSAVVARVDSRAEIARSGVPVETRLEGRCPSCSRSFSIPIARQR